jgi:hypothetical protein
MDMIGEFVRRLFLELRPITDWAARNWAVTCIALIAYLYWSVRQKRLRRHHL